MDYKPLYYTLFHAMTKADALLDGYSAKNAQEAKAILEKAQKDTESLFMDHSPGSTVKVHFKHSQK